MISIFALLPYSVKYEKVLDKNRSYIFVPNNFSYHDITMAMICTKGNIRFMAKMELGNIPIFSIFFRTIDISVNRGSKTDSYRAWQKANESLDKNYSLIIFAEGTIGKNPPELLQFKNGPFRLAIEKQVPVVPITMLDNWRCLRFEGNEKFGKPAFLRNIVHAPIETTGMTLQDEPMLRKKVRDIINQELQKVYPELLNENNTFTQNINT